MTTAATRRWRVRIALPSDIRRLSWWRDQWRRRPRFALGIRAAIAAALAWVVAGLLPGPAADYPYYAPFGAVIATTFTLAGSVRESVQAVGAIAVGGLVGWGVDLLPLPVAPAVALTVVLAVVLAGWRVLGPMGGWVPTAALFSLILGQPDGTFAWVYPSLTMVGALIGIGVNAAFPPLPLAPAERAVRLFRRTLAQEIEKLADLLESEELPTLQEWEDKLAAPPSQRAQMHAAVSEVGEAARRNPRARRYSGSIDTVRFEAQTLDRLALTVNDLADLLLSDLASDTVDRTETLSGEVREKLCAALRTIAEALENTTAAGTADPHAENDDELPDSGDAADAVQDAREIAPRRDDQLLIDGILISLQRAVDSLDQIERTD